MAASSLSAALYFTRELAFGVLAILGCILVQCLILAFILLPKAQIRFVFLQAQMLRQLYERPSDSEQRPSADGNRSTKKATNAKVKSPNAEPSTQAQPAELPTAHTTPPKVTPPTETATWQTKELVPRKMGGRRPYAMKQVDALTPVGIAPPGLGPPDPARLLALDTSSNVVYEVTKGGPVSVLTGDLTDEPKPTRQTVATTKSDRFGFPLGPTSVEPYTEFDTRRNADDTSITVFEHIQNSSGHVDQRLAEDLGDGPQRKIARRSAIRKVQPAQTGNAQTSTDMRPDHSNGSVDTSNYGTTAAIYKNVRPAEFSDLQHRFIDTSQLRKASRAEPQQTLSARAKPLSPEEAARKALTTAFSERESSRVKLNTNYSIDGALEFDEKAEVYNMRREQLAALMPGKTLSSEDKMSFPWLSAKDTMEPQTSVVPHGPQKELNVMPSPPTSSDEEDAQRQHREDPAPLIAKASRAFQVLLQATRNMTNECSKCNSRFCPEGYEQRTSKFKLKSAKDLYLKSRHIVMSLYEGDEVPEWLSQKLPGIKEC
ncbi:hypothetical protein MBLNU13_g06490t1 [Cladosporium sp. NU13]